MENKMIHLFYYFYTFAHLKRRLNDEKNKQKMQKFG